MTSTPEEPEPDPQTVPAGDPAQGAPGNGPQDEPDTLPDARDAATGTDPEDAEQVLGPGVND